MCLPLVRPNCWTTASSLKVKRPMINSSISRAPVGDSLAPCRPLKERKKKKKKIAYSLRPTNNCIFYFYGSCLIFRLIQKNLINIIYFFMTYCIVRYIFIMICLFYYLHKKLNKTNGQTWIIAVKKIFICGRCTVVIVIINWYKRRHMPVLGEMRCHHGWWPPLAN